MLLPLLLMLMILVTVHASQALYEKYKAMANKEEGVAFVGRLASYKYFNMDQAILNALEMFDDVVAQGKLKKKD